LNEVLNEKTREGLGKVNRGNYPGPSNPNWKGGRVIDPRGYVLVKVGKEHPLADVRGYAYEHRLVASKAAGRVLDSSELVHHKDHQKGNNSGENLAILTSQLHTSLHNSRKRTDLRLFSEDNPIINCACGCGRQLLKFDSEDRPRRYLRRPSFQKALAMSCPGSACAGCYSVGTISGTERYLHPPSIGPGFKGDKEENELRLKHGGKKQK
jgi:hypothetical protein